MAKINIAKTSGFCFGVRRALTIAMQTARDNNNVYMLGDIVHNEDVVSQIEKTGIKKVNSLSYGNDRILIIRAHGTCNKTLKEAETKGYKIVDATCPMVKEIHRIVKDMEKRGYKIIVLGDKKHDEVHGIIGQLKKNALVIDPERPSLKGVKRIKKACVVCQSTQYKKNVLNTLSKLKKRIKIVRFFDTICLPTKQKQKEIESLPLQNDVIIIIGSKKSANTKRLYDISRLINNNTFWVNRREDLRKSWFRGAKDIGITAGASTPDKTIKDITAAIRNITQAS